MQDLIDQLEDRNQELGRIVEELEGELQAMRRDFDAIDTIVRSHL
jgi:hypothetical protein